MDRGDDAEPKVALKPPCKQTESVEIVVMLLKRRFDRTAVLKARREHGALRISHQKCLRERFGFREASYRDLNPKWRRTDD